MPVCFALATHFVGGEHAPIFASFGSFALLSLVDFSGRAASRLIAYLGLAVAVGALIAAGTLCSENIILATALAATLTFAIFYSGVINGYLAAARTTAVLMVALPLMIPADPSVIDERLYGWAIACAISIPALFLIWRAPWSGPLKNGCAMACDALADLIEEPTDPGLREAADQAVIAVRRRFLATPHRPTGPTGSAAAVAALVEELGWLMSLFWRLGPSIVEGAGPEARELRRACAGTLRDSARVLKRRKGLVSTDEIEVRRADLVDALTVQVEARELRDSRLKEDLGRTFRLRLLSFSVTEAAGFANIAAGDVRAPGALGERWLKVLGRGRREAEAAGLLLIEHADPRSAWLRNSLRGAVGIALAVFVAELTEAHNAFWVVLGTLSVLRSNALGTESSAVSALLGTIAGILAGGFALLLIGDHQGLLWVALPLTVFAAAFAPKAISFAAGQAGFSMMVMILFNLIDPVGLEVGVVRAEDIAAGCAVGLAIGFLMWPRGAKELIRTCLGEAYESGSKLIADRVELAIRGEEADLNDPVRLEAIAAKDRLDAALRQRLDETSAARIDAASLVGLAACSARLMRSAHSFRMLVLMPRYEKTPVELVPTVDQVNGQVRSWYRDCATAMRESGDLRPAVPAGDSLDTAIVEAIERAGEGHGSIHSALAGGWLIQGLEHLIFLEDRVARHADRLFADSKGEERDRRAGRRRYSTG